MWRLRRLVSKLLNFLLPARAEAELNRELDSHSQLLEDEFVRQGMTLEDARRAARASFGGIEQAKELQRSERSIVWLDQLRQDLSYGARGLLRARGFTIGAVAVLGLGVGANLALWQIFDATIVHRYSVPDVEQFVRFSRTSRDDLGGISRTFPVAAIEFYRQGSNSFASLISEDKSFTVAVDGAPGRPANFVSDNYFSTVAVHPVVGRLFDVHDADSDETPVTLLGQQYWQSQFGADPQVLGRSIHVNDSVVRIIGVLPKGFYGFTVGQPDLWFLSSKMRLLLNGSPSGQAQFFGKLKPGTSMAAGAVELTALTRELARRQPRYFDVDDRIQADLVQEPLLQFFLTRSPAIVIFGGMVLLILLSACAHLGNMILVRGLARQREFSIRIAIGAGRDRLIRQLATENVLLSILGSAAGLAAGVIAARVMLLSLDSTFPFDATIHWQTVVACVTMTFVSVFAFGLPTARETTRQGFNASTLRSRFVANQVAVSCVLLAVTGAFAVKRMLDESLDLTFEYRNLVVIDPQLFAREGPADAMQRRLDALSERFRALSGVEAVTIATAVPFRGRIVDNFPQYPRVQRSAVAPSFFEVMGLSVLRGRTFLPGEQDAVVASEVAARSLWPNQDPLGQEWKVAGSKHTVVGVVQDSWPKELNPGGVEAYLPILNRDVDHCVLILRTRGNPALVMGAAPRLAAELNETVSVTSMTAIRDVVFQKGNSGTTLIGSMALVATALAGAGMFSLIAFSVQQRRRELGIRIAIGATRRDLVFGLLRLQFEPLACGLLKGTFAAIILLLFVRAVVDPEPYIVLIGGLALGLSSFFGVAALAMLIPALQAVSMDPSEALRSE